MNWGGTINKPLTTTILLIILVSSLSCCISFDDFGDDPDVKIDGEFSIVNGYGDGYRDGIKLEITAIDPEDAVLDSGDVKVELLDKEGKTASGKYHGKISQIDFNEQVSFSNMYDCEDDKDTLDKGDYITFWYKENSNGYEPNLDGYTISLYWKGQKVFSKKINSSELEFINSEKIEKCLSLSISTNRTKYFASPNTTVGLDVTILNKGNVTYLIDEPSLILNSLQIEIITPQGYKIYHQYSVLMLPDAVEIYSQVPIELSIVIGGETWNDNRLSFKEKGFYFDVKGEYFIKATYETGRAMNENVVSYKKNKILTFTI